jgi:antitoxin HicB
MRFSNALGWMIDMATTKPNTLADYLALEYPFNVIAAEKGGYIVVFPDLPGCSTDVETIDEIPAFAEEARSLWIETAYEDGQEIPLPSYPEEYSGKFVVRLPKALHRSLAEAAGREGVSLNQYVATLLARGDTQAQIERRLDGLVSTLRISDAGPSVTLSAPAPRGTPTADPAVRRTVSADSP